MRRIKVSLCTRCCSGAHCPCCFPLPGITSEPHLATNSGCSVSKWQVTSLSGQWWAAWWVPFSERQYSGLTGWLWHSNICARKQTHHPSGSRWSPPCAPQTQAQPGTPGWWPLCRSGHHEGSHKCTASAWCLVWRSRSSRKSRHCSIWLHSSPLWHWLSQISGLREKKRYACVYGCCGTSDP